MSASCNTQQLFPGLSLSSAQTLATSHGFCQKAKFQTGAAPLISIIEDCNYLTSSYTPKGTWREICFSKCSFIYIKYHRPALEFSYLNAPQSCFPKLCECRCWRSKLHFSSLPTQKVLYLPSWWKYIPLQKRMSFPAAYILTNAPCTHAGHQEYTVSTFRNSKPDRDSSIWYRLTM